jgi:uncharacterized protein YegP (UPF0339 family)
MASFEIISFKSTDYRVLYNNTDTIEFTSIACRSKNACIKLIAAIRKNSIKNTAYEIGQLSCGSWYFFLKNINTNVVLGRSKTYIEKSIAEERLKMIQLNMPNAEYISKHHLFI